jgi:hypothetical protein
MTPSSFGNAVLLLGGVLALGSTPVSAAEPGDLVQVDNLGMNVVTWNLSKDTHKTVADEQVLSEFVGLQYYPWKDVRLGLNLQFSEQLNPAPKTGSRFRTFALLPQVGWNVGGPFFVAGILTIAPWTAGGANLILGVQALGGVAFEIAPRVKLSVALEVPINFYPDWTVGLTPLAGVSFRL